MCSSKLCVLLKKQWLKSKRKKTDFKCLTKETVGVETAVLQVNSLARCSLSLFFFIYLFCFLVYLFWETVSLSDPPAPQGQGRRPLPPSFLFQLITDILSKISGPKFLFLRNLSQIKGFVWDEDWKTVPGPECNFLRLLCLNWFLQKQGDNRNIIQLQV